MREIKEILKKLEGYAILTDQKTEYFKVVKISSN